MLALSHWKLAAPIPIQSKLLSYTLSALTLSIISLIIKFADCGLRVRITVCVHVVCAIGVIPNL